MLPSYKNLNRFFHDAPLGKFIIYYYLRTVVRTKLAGVHIKNPTRILHMHFFCVKSKNISMHLLDHEAQRPE